MFALLLLMAVQQAAAAAAQLNNPRDVPARLQWPNAGGYCGETSAQMTALLNGAWISQSAWRAAGGGPAGASGQLLLSVNLESALTKMRLRWNSWEQSSVAKGLASSGKPQYSAFMVWMRDRLRAGVPVIFGEFLSDAGGDPDYDHIVPAVGASSAAATSSNYLTFFNLYDAAPLVLKFSRLNATRRGCARSLQSGGCIPSNVDYGVAVTGVADANKVTLPVRLDVDRRDEPNTSPVNKRDPDEYRTAPQPAAQLRGSVTVSGLTPKASYRLMRYASAAAVPTKGSAAAFLASAYTASVDFVAAGAEWRYADPVPFLSSSTTFYRCVRRP